MGVTQPPGCRARSPLPPWWGRACPGPGPGPRLVKDLLKENKESRSTGPGQRGLSTSIFPLVLSMSHVTATRPPGPMVLADGRAEALPAGGSLPRPFCQSRGRSGTSPRCLQRSGGGGRRARGPVVSRGRRSVLGCHTGSRHPSPAQQRKGHALCTETRALRVTSVRLLQVCLHRDAKGRPPDPHGPGRGLRSPGWVPGPPRSLAR